MKYRCLYESVLDRAIGTYRRVHNRRGTRVKPRVLRRQAREFTILLLL